MIRAMTVVTLLALAGNAQAASTDVVFKGGGNFTSTSGCTGWNPAKEFFLGTYWVPVASSTNGPDSVITFHFGNGTAEGFQRDEDVLTSAYKSVRGMHIYTRIGTYDAFIKISSRVPTTITKTTQSVTVTGTVKGWDETPTCAVNFTMNLVRNLQP